jgi:hypothetical protein
MTEREWLECNDPEPMLAVVKDRECELSRKLRLFGVACCYRLFLIDADLSRHVRLAKHFADGLARPEQLRRISDN